MATVDLWPDAITDESGLEGPTSLLKAQATLLGPKTKNLVEAEVKTASSSRADQFVDEFFIISPTINYRYSLFKVVYPVEFFPASVVWDGYAEMPDEARPTGKANNRMVHSLEELEREVRVIFSHIKTVRVIKALIVRSRA